MSVIKFRATITSEKRIKIPARLENFAIGDKILVTIEPLPPTPTPQLNEKSTISEG